MIRRREPFFSHRLGLHFASRSDEKRTKHLMSSRPVIQEGISTASTLTLPPMGPTFVTIITVVSSTFGSPRRMETVRAVSECPHDRLWENQGCRWPERLKEEKQSVQGQGREGHAGNRSCLGGDQTAGQEAELITQAHQRLF